jgi:hypothetical protein
MTPIEATIKKPMKNLKKKLKKSIKFCAKNTSDIQKMAGKLWIDRVRAFF